MSALPVAHVLRDLESDSGLAKKSRALPDLPFVAGKRDAESRIEEARTRGVAEGRGFGAQEAAFEQKFSIERQKWASEQGERLSNLIKSEVSDFELRIADKLAKILKPVLAQEVRRRAVSELVELLEGLLSKGEIARLAVSGPEDLLAMLRTQLDGKIASVSYVASAACDLRITADETIFETRIGDWMRAIAGEER
jgi:hypothetical protein